MEMNSRDRLNGEQRKTVSPPFVTGDDQGTCPVVGWRLCTHFFRFRTRVLLSIQLVPFGIWSRIEQVCMALDRLKGLIRHTWGIQHGYQ